MSYKNTQIQRNASFVFCIKSGIQHTKSRIMPFFLSKKQNNKKCCQLYLPFCPTKTGYHAPQTACAKCALGHRKNYTASRKNSAASNLNSDASNLNFMARSFYGIPLPFRRIS